MARHGKREASKYRGMLECAKGMPKQEKRLKIKWIEKTQKQVQDERRERIG